MVPGVSEGSGGMSEWEPPEIPYGLPCIVEREKPVLYLPDGREVTVKKPVGFARHPYVPTGKVKA